jgi:hypothetical protein
MVIDPYHAYLVDRIQKRAENLRRYGHDVPTDRGARARRTTARLLLALVLGTFAVGLCLLVLVVWAG